MYRVSGAYLQSGALPYRVGKHGRPEVLVVLSDSKRWTIPKGRTEPHLSLADNAAKEAFEEAGVIGEIALRPSGTYRATKRCDSGRMTIEVWVYLLRVTEAMKRWPEKQRRQARWVSCPEAARLLGEPLLQRLCRQLEDAAKTTARRDDRPLVAAAVRRVRRASRRI